MGWVSIGKLSSGEGNCACTAQNKLQYNSNNYLFLLLPFFVRSNSQNDQNDYEKEETDDTGNNLGCPAHFRNLKFDNFKNQFDSRKDSQ